MDTTKWQQHFEALVELACLRYNSISPQARAPLHLTGV